MNIDLRNIVLVLVTLLVLAALLGVGLLFVIHRRLRRIVVPAQANFATTLRMVPLSLCIALDLLDFAFDVFATPIVWVVLSRYRLQALRNVAAVEALIPFTQVIPTLTVAWFVVRIFDLGDPYAARRILEADQVAPGYYAPRSGRR